MSVLYYLKDPPITLAAKGELSEKAIKELCKTLNNHGRARPGRVLRRALRAVRALCQKRRNTVRETATTRPATIVIRIPAFAKSLMLK